MEEQLNSNRNELGNLSLRDLFFKYIRFLPLFIFSVTVMLFAAYAYLRYATRIYSAGGTLVIKNDQQKNSNNDKFEELFGTNKTVNVQSEIEILRSRPLMTRVVNQLNLQTSYSAVGRIRTENIYKQGPFLLQIYKLTDSSRSFTLNIKVINDSQFHINNDKAVFTFDSAYQNPNGVFSLVRNPRAGIGKEYNITWQPASTVAASLVGSLQVTPKTQGTSILSLSIQGTNAIMCADIVNELMAQYQQVSIEDKNSTAELTLRFIDDRMDSLGRDLDSINKIKLRYQKENDVIDLQAQAGIYFQNINETDKSLYEQQFQFNVADFVDNYLRDTKNQHNKIVSPSALATDDPVPSSLGLKDPVLNGYIEAYNTAQLKRQDLLNSNIPASNPAVKEQDALIAKTRANILESLKNIKASFNSAINDLKQKSGALQSEIRTLPLKTQEYLEILRLVDSKQNLYKILQQKREETAISRAATIPNSQVIEKAVPSYSPIKPNKRAILILAILIGLGIPALFIFVGEILNDKITTRFDIERVTTVPILGEIGHSFSGGALVVNKTTRSMVAEQFRIIRSNLQYVLSKIDKSVILVTSSFSGEGKSFVCTNLGAVMALAGKKTIILEFDIRKPKILSGLGIAKRPGITNFIVNKTPVEELILPVPDSDNLYVLGCGPVPPNPAELLLEPGVEDLFSYLKQEFDIILVDTAPVGMVSDAMTLSKFADCTLYLVRQGHTFKKQVGLIDDFYRENKLPKVSIIINDVKLKPGYGYYGYGRYGYGYGYNYSSYYDEEHPKPTAIGNVLRWVGIKRKRSRSVKK